MKNKAFLVIAAALAICFYTGCKTFDQPKDIVKPLDYTDKDVVNNEINTIHELLKDDYTKALFRAYLLGDQDVLSECISVVRQNADKAIEENNYTLAIKLLKSIDSIPANENEIHSL